MKPSGAPGGRIKQIGPEPEILADEAIFGALSPRAPGLLHPDPGVREGPLLEGGRLSEPAGWGVPGAALPLPGKGARVPGRGGRGTPEVWGGELPWQPEWVQGWVRGCWAALYKHFNNFFLKKIRLSQNSHWASC